MVEEKDVFAAAVGETETAGDFSQGAGAQFFVKADGGVLEATAMLNCIRRKPQSQSA